MKPIDMKTPSDIVGAFVWIRGLRGPYAEKRPRDMPVNITTKTHDVLAEHPLTAGEYDLKIAILEQRYPPPKT